MAVHGLELSKSYEQMNWVSSNIHRSLVVLVKHDILFNPAVVQLKLLKVVNTHSDVSKSN